MKYSLIMLMLITTIFTAKGQDYEASVGLRGGVTSGITYKILLHKERAFEGIMSFRQNGIQFTGLVINHEPFLFKYSDKIFAYYGMGIHLGYYGKDYCKDGNCDEYAYFSPNLGMDGILGLEYRFLKIPLTAGVDFKPYLDIFGRSFFRFNFYDFALSAKYTF